MNPGIYDNPGLGKKCVLSSGIMLSNTSDIDPSEVSTDTVRNELQR